MGSLQALDCNSHSDARTPQTAGVMRVDSLIKGISRPIKGDCVHLIAAGCFLLINACCARCVAAERPNIILILVDDMGYSDIGCYGGEIQTPNIDRLAADGIRFTNMYNTSKCFPSRACLLTGVYAQQCNMGRSPKGGIQNASTIADRLRASGYRTLAVGKHHSTISLMDKGFDRFHGFHYGEGKSSANHFNPGVQREGEGVPARKRGETRTYRDDEQKLIPFFTPQNRDWYTTDSFTDWALEYLDEYKHEDRPYFLYLSFTAPHDPLHAWPEDIAKYAGVYDTGFEGIRASRFARQQQLGIVPPGVRLSPSTHRAWSALTEQERRDQARRMQVYAAMIDRVDQNVGRILQKLRQLEQDRNTLVLFASDNGCSSENVNTGQGEIGSLTRWASLQRDWANVSNTPFRYWKNLSHEGGICTPFIVSWPAASYAKGSINRRPLHFIDIARTLSELAGPAAETQRTAVSQTPLQGESFVAALKGRPIAPREKPIFWEYAKGGAIRDGKWKLVTKSLPRRAASAEGEWELYDLDADPTEIDDLAAMHPVEVRRLSQLWFDWYREVYGL